MDVILINGGATKLAVVKLVKEITGLGNQEAMGLVNQVPKSVREGIPKEEAEVIKKALEEAGAIVKIVGNEVERDFDDSNFDNLEKKESKDDFDDFA